MRTENGFRIEGWSEAVLQSSGNANTPIQMCPASAIVAITALTAVGNLATASTGGNAHNLSEGQLAYITGANDAAWNGYYPVHVIDAFTFTYRLASLPAAVYGQATVASFKVKMALVYADPANGSPVTIGPNVNAIARVLAAGQEYEIPQLKPHLDQASKFDLSQWYFKSAGVNQTIRVLWVCIALMFFFGSLSANAQYRGGGSAGITSFNAWNLTYTNLIPPNAVFTDGGGFGVYNVPVVAGQTYYIWMDPDIDENAAYTPDGLQIAPPGAAFISATNSLRLENNEATTGPVTMRLYLVTNNFYGTFNGILNTTVSTGILPISSGGTGTNNARDAGSAIGILQMSPAGGNNAYADMDAATSSFAGQIAMSRFGNKALYIWGAPNANANSNNWRATQFNFPGGLGLSGNSQWRDSTNDVLNVGVDGAYGGTTFYQQFGSNQSTRAAAYVGGLTNVGPNIIQPYVSVVNGNPHSGAAQFQVKAAFTNSIHGSLLGINADGTNVYSPQYGLALFQIGDAYETTVTNNPMGEGLLSSDNKLVKYWSLNGQRPSDTGPGQIPMFVLDMSQGYAAPMKAGFPFQVANHWSALDPLFRYAFLADEQSGNTYATNGTLTVSALSSIGTATANNATVTNTLTVKTSTITTGTGSPNTVVTAPIGSLFLRSDGGAATTLYVKESGAGNTGWVAK